MTTAITGTVTKTNGNGFRLDAHEGWLNVSRYAKLEDAPIPAVGDRVTARLDKAGFVRRIEHVPPVGQSEPEPPAPTPAASVSPDKDRLMLRMSALRGACDVFTGTGTSVEAVKLLAEDLEAWALR